MATHDILNGPAEMVADALFAARRITRRDRTDGWLRKAASLLPTVDVASIDPATLEALRGWSQWNDPNGCHTAELYRAEYGEDPTAEETIEALASMLADWSE